MRGGIPITDETPHYATLLRILFVGVLFLFAVLARTENHTDYENGLFWGTDSYRFYRQAEIIVEHGRLPEVDAERWLPEGRNLRTHLNLSSYAIAYLYHTVNWIAPQTSLYQVACTYSIVCFLASALVLYLFAVRLAGTSYAVLTLVFYLFFPPLIERSSFGFCDRDALCLVWILWAFYCLARAADLTGWVGLLWRALSGISIGLLALTWEGAGVFVLVLVLFQMMEVLTDSQPPWHMGAFLLPICLLTLPLTDAYEGKANFHTPIELLLWVPLLALGLLVLVLEYVKRTRKLGAFLGNMSIRLGLLVGVFGGSGLITALLFGVPDVDMLYRNFLSTLGGSRLMTSVGELQQVPFEGFQHLFSYFLLIYLGGMLLLFHDTVGKTRSYHYVPMFAWLLFLLLIVISSLTVAHQIYPFLIPVLLGTCLASMLIWWDQDAHHQAVLLLLYSMVVLILARGAVRYVFFLLPSVALSSSYLLWRGYQRLGLSQRHFSIYLLGILLLQLMFLFPSMDQTLRAAGSLGFIAVVLAISKQKRMRACVFALGLASVLFLLEGAHMGTGGGLKMYLKQNRFRASQADVEAMRWIQENTPRDSVVYGTWSLGSQINMLAQRKTVIDEDHYRPYWIHLAYRHVHFAETEQEALEFLYTRGVTHLLLSERELSLLKRNSQIASDTYHDRDMSVHHVAAQFKQVPDKLRLNFPMRIPDLTGESVQVIVENDTGELANVHAYQVYLLMHTGERKAFSRVVLNGKDVPLEDTGARSSYSLIGYMRYDGEQLTLESVVLPDYHIDTFVIRLYLLAGEGLRYFRKIYETPASLIPFRSQHAQVWEVSCPEHLAEHPEYFLPDFPDEELRDAWYYDR